MRLVWVVIPLILIVSMIGIVGFYSPAFATECGGLLTAFQYGEVFSGNVKSIEIEWYDKPIRDVWGDDGPTYYGVQHAVFDVHRFFKGTTFEIIDYQTPIPSMDPASAYNSYLEVGKEYLVIGYQQNSTVSSNGCSGGSALEIVDSIKNSETYTKATNSLELLVAMSEYGILEGNSNAVDYILSPFIQMSHSPKIQLQDNISPKKILCKEGLQLYFKNNYDSTPVCVKPSTVDTLMERGWGHERFIDKKPNNIIQINDSKNYLKYRITDNSVILNASYNDESNSIIIKIDSTSEGNLTVELSHALFDSCYSLQYTSHDVEFFVLINSEEMQYSIVKNTDETLTLSIPFHEHSIDIEIIGTCWS